MIRVAPIVVCLLFAFPATAERVRVISQKDAAMLRRAFPEVRLETDRDYILLKVLYARVTAVTHNQQKTSIALMESCRTLQLHALEFEPLLHRDYLDKLGRVVEPIKVFADFKHLLRIQEVHLYGQAGRTLRVLRNEFGVVNGSILAAADIPDFATAQPGDEGVGAQLDPTPMPAQPANSPTAPPAGTQGTATDPRPESP